MKRLAAKLLVFVLLAVCTAASGETLVTYGGTFMDGNTGLQEFLAENPDTSLSWPDAYYYPSSAFISALLTREFQCDLFLQGTNQADWHTLMAKGYCLDLSESPALTAAVLRMHPRIAEQAMYNGQLYAIPTGINFMYYQIDPMTWEKAGFTTADVPQSFPEFLDFLSAWCDRLEEQPEPEIAVLGGWDSETYSSTAYTSRLTEMLISEATMQLQYTGEDLTFHTPELTALLERCADIGSRLVRLESRSCTSTLFEQLAGGMWPSIYSSVVFLRLNDTRPKLIRSAVYMWAINADSKSAEKSLALLEKAATVIDNPESGNDLFLYRDTKPRISPTYETELAHWTEQQAAIEMRLQDESLALDTKEALEDELITYTEAIERTEANKWLVTPSQLEDYRRAADMLYFPAPNLFEQSAEGNDTLQELYQQFSHQKLTADQMLQKLDRIAEMMRLEE